METVEPQKGYCEGDVSPGLKKKIHTLIVKSKDYVVFLDEDFYVEWEELGDFKYAENYCDVMNRVAYLETISTTHIRGGGSRKIELLEFRRLLGEAVARVFDGSGDSAVSILDQAEQLLIDRSTQQARKWYLFATAIATAFPVLILGILWWSRENYRVSLGQQGFEVAVCACLGGIGALISTIIRVRRVTLNASAGATPHIIEGVARVVVGIVAGGLIALAIKSNIILGITKGFSNPRDAFAFLACMALASGASERVVPNFIEQIETRASVGVKESGNPAE